LEVVLYTRRPSLSMTASDAMPVDTPAVAAEAAAPAEAAVAAAKPVPPAAADKEEAGSPQKPKKALSAYWIYSNEMREEVIKAQKEANGGKAKFGEIAKEISAKWAALPEAEKKVFEDRAAADKQRFASELKTYMEASDPAGTLRMKYQHLIPKKPVTAYMAFSQDPAKREKAVEALKAEGKEAGSRQVAAKLSEMWKAAPAEEKAPYEDQQRKEHGEFVEKQKAWQATAEFAEIERAEKAQEEKRKAAEAEQKAVESKEKAEKEAKSAKKRSRSAAAAESTPKAKEAKEKKTPQSAPASDSKRPRKNVARDEPAALQLDEKVLAEAAKLGFEGALRNLAARPEVVASGKQARALLDALQASKGLVNPAKRALLGM